MNRRTFLTGLALTPLAGCNRSPSSGGFSLVIGQHGHTSGRFYKPRGIEVFAPERRLYVVDWDGRIQSFDFDGTFRSSWIMPEVKNGKPEDLCFTPDGHMLVADTHYHRILEFDPNHEQAILYLKDIEATQDMYYDEDQARQEARMKQLLGRPVTDFELSVRSRNCLSAMDINTLGDLTEISEQELLAGKNFGETSLLEIRELLAAHGLRIGMNLHKVHSRDSFVDQNLSPEEQAIMNRPIGDLNLSVRSRKCMNRLAIQTIGQLVSRTPDELLASRNFGVTSLNEIRLKLGELDIKLRND